MEERIHTIPLRKEWLKAPKWKRANKTINAIKKYALKHYRTSDVRIGTGINQKIWERGSQNPPHKLKVTAVKTTDKVFMELYGTPVVLPEVKEEKKKTKKESKEEKLEDSLKTKTTKVEKKTENKIEEAVVEKAIEQEEVKEVAEEIKEVVKEKVSEEKIEKEAEKLVEEK